MQSAAHLDSTVRASMLRRMCVNALRRVPAAAAARPGGRDVDAFAESAACGGRRMPHRVGGRASTTSPASSLSSRRWIATTPSHLASKWHPARAAKAAAAARAAAAEEDGGVASVTAEQRAAVLAKLPSVCPGCGVGLQ